MRSSTVRRSERPLRVVSCLTELYNLTGSLEAESRHSADSITKLTSPHRICNPVWPLMNQLDDGRLYHKCVAYAGLGGPARYCSYGLSWYAVVRISSGGLYTYRVYGDHCAMERPLASIPSGTDADSIPVLVDIVPPGTAQDQHPDIPDRLKLGEDLPSPELIRVALRLWRDIRETGVVPEEHCLYHIVWCILSLADHRVLSSPVLAALEEQIRAAADRDKDTLERQLEGEADRIVAGTLRECGEADMALLYETNRVEFHRLCDAGSKRSLDPAETGNARTSAVIRSRQVRRLSLREITGGLTRYWARLAHTLNGR